ncbi:hypothetical protein MMPV_001352 [Pyropia vietnamensis]
MAPFCAIGFMVRETIIMEYDDDKVRLSAMFEMYSQSLACVLIEEPGHKVLSKAGQPEKVQAIRDKLLGTISEAAYAVVAHFGPYKKAWVYTADQEAAAARRFGDIDKRHTMVMWSAGADGPVASHGEEEMLTVCNNLAKEILAESTVGEGESAAPAESTPTNDDESASTEEAKIACWMVGTKEDLTAFDSEKVAKQAFISGARNPPAVLIAQPGNNVLDSAGDDDVVQEVVDDIAAALASTTYAVAHYTHHTSGKIHTGDRAEASARAEYENVQAPLAKAMWKVGEDTAVAKSGDSQKAGLSSELARKLVEVAATAEAPATEEGESDSETETPEVTYWLVGHSRPKLGTSKVLASGTLEFAKGLYDYLGSDPNVSATMLMSMPGMVVLESSGDTTPVEELQADMQETVSSVYGVVATSTGSRIQAILYSRQEYSEARFSYSQLPFQVSRALWTLDQDSPVLTSGKSAEGIRDANNLAKAILMIADTPEPVAVPIRYHTVSFYKGDEVIVKAYDTEANALIQYKRLDEDFPRALAGQPGNRTVESSPGSMPASILTEKVFPTTRKAAETVRWVMVRRVYQRAEASLRPKHTESKEAAVAAFDRIKKRGARGVWGADDPAAIKTNGYATWVGRCEKLAAAILRREQE